VNWVPASEAGAGFSDGLEGPVSPLSALWAQVSGRGRAWWRWPATRSARASGPVAQQEYAEQERGFGGGPGALGLGQRALRRRAYSSLNAPICPLSRQILVNAVHGIGTYMSAPTRRRCFIPGSAQGPAHGERIPGDRSPAPWKTASVVALVFRNAGTLSPVGQLEPAVTNLGLTVLNSKGAEYRLQMKLFGGFASTPGNPHAHWPGGVSCI
jgi:hypothetical protein